MQNLNDEEIIYHKLMKNLVITQTYLESLDEVKDVSTFYKFINKKRINDLVKELEKTLGSKFVKIFNRDEKSFQTIIGDIEIVAEWLSKNSFEDIHALAEVMKNNDKICNYLDIPIQHSSNKIRKEMRREGTKEELLEVINQIISE